MVESKSCYRCGEERPIAQFYPHAGMKSGRLNLCASCKVDEATAWRKANPVRFNEMRFSRDIKKYGITIEQYLEKLRKQGGVCAGCFSQPVKRRLCVDHDHATGKIRGLLCHDCNRTIATAHDNPEVLRKLASYLTEGKPQ